MSNRHEHETATPNAQAQEAHLESHGASVPFYTFIAVVLGIITYIEFAIVEHQDSWFVWLSRFWIFFWLILLSVVKFFLVVMFFMHLKQDHRAFTGFFTSGMVIAVGTLIALGALFTVRSVAEAQVPPEPHVAHHEDELHAVPERDERTLIERLEYPAPKTQDARAGLAQTIPGSEGMGGSGLQANVLPADAEEIAPDASTADPDTTPTGMRAASTLPPADPAPPITLPDPFAPGGAEEQAEPQASEPEAAPEGEAAEATATEEAASEEAAGDEASSSAEGPLLSEADLSSGETVYSANCVSCHQAEGQGVPGAFPPLAGHTPELALPEGGRDYLVNVLLYGLQGEIEVDGQSYNGVMPAWQQLSDEELAGVLNYTLSSWGNLEAMPEDYAAFTPEEVAEQRDAGLSAAQVYEQRQALELP